MGETNPSNFNTLVYTLSLRDSSQILNSFGLFLTEKCVAGLKLYYVYWKTEQLSKCDDVGNQDFYYGRRKIFYKEKNDMQKGKKNLCNSQLKIFLK